MSCITARGIIALKAIEDGYRGDDWKERVLSEIRRVHPESPDLTEGQYGKLYTEARLELAERQDASAVKGDIKRTDSMAVASHIIQRLGRKGAAGFYNDLTEPDGTTPILDRLHAGTSTPQDFEAAARAWVNNQAGGAREAKPNVGPLRDLVQAVNDYKAQERMAARPPKPEPVPRTPAGPKVSPLDFVKQHLARIYGAEGRDRIVTALQHDGVDPILQKVADGTLRTPDETTALHKALHEEITRQLDAKPAEIDEAKRALNETRAAAADAVKHEVESATTLRDVIRQYALKGLDREQANKLSSDLANVKDDDYAGLAKVMKNHQGDNSTWAKIASIYRANLLWHLKGLAIKIIPAHVAWVAFKEGAKTPGIIGDLLNEKITGRRSITTSRPEDIKAALAEAGHAAKSDLPYLLRHGEDANAIRRLQTGDNPLLARVGHGVEGMGGQVAFPDTKAGRMMQLYVDTPYRVHGAAYAPMRAFLLELARRQEARVEAINEANALRKSGQAVPKDFVNERFQKWYSEPTPEMEARAIYSTEEGMFANRSAITDFWNRGRSALPPAGRALADVAIPFPKVSTNIGLRLGESAGGGIGYAAGGVIKHILQHEEIPQAVQAQYSNMIGRNALGVGGVMALGYYLYSKGYIQPTYGSLSASDKKSGVEGGTINGVKIFGKPLSYENMAPVGKMLVLGATYGKLSDDNSWDKNILLTVGSLTEDLPFSDPARNYSKLTEAGSAKKVVGKMVGSELQEQVPFGLSDIASALDNGRRVQEDTPADYIQGAVPGLRNKLPNWVPPVRASADSSPSATRPYPHTSKKTGATYYSKRR